MSRIWESYVTNVDRKVLAHTVRALKPTRCAGGQKPALTAGRAGGYLSAYEPRVHLLGNPIFLCFENPNPSPMRPIDDRVRAGLIIDFLDFEVGRRLPLQGRPPLQRFRIVRMQAGLWPPPILSNSQCAFARDPICPDDANQIGNCEHDPVDIRIKLMVSPNYSNCNPCAQ